jgi:hypothetical protein
MYLVLIKKKVISLRKFRPKEGENWFDVSIRVKDFIDELIKRFVRNENNLQNEIIFEEKKFPEFKSELINVLKKDEIQQRMENLNLENEIFSGFKNDTDMSRLLLVTHGGVIMELNNVIYKYKGIDMVGKNNSFNCGLYVIKIYCLMCGNTCKNLLTCKLEFDYILFNDNKHCKDLK